MTAVDWDDVENAYSLAVSASRSIVVHTAYEQAWQAAVDDLWRAIDGVAAAREREQKARADADEALGYARQLNALHEEARW